MTASPETPFGKRIQILTVILTFVAGVIAGGIPTYLVQHHNEYLDKQMSDRRDAYKNFYTQVEVSFASMTKAVNLHGKWPSFCTLFGRFWRLIWPLRRVVLCAAPATDAIIAHRRLMVAVVMGG